MKTYRVYLTPETAVFWISMESVVCASNLEANSSTEEWEVEDLTQN